MMFATICDFVKVADIGALVPQKEKLKAYGLLQQSKKGEIPAGTRRPGMLKFRARAKFDAWKSFTGTSKNEAKKAFMDEVCQQMAKYGQGSTWSNITWRLPSEGVDTSGYAGGCGGATGL